MHGTLSKVKGGDTRCHHISGRTHRLANIALSPSFSHSDGMHSYAIEVTGTPCSSNDILRYVAQALRGMTTKCGCGSMSTLDFRAKSTLFACTIENIQTHSSMCLQGFVSSCSSPALLPLPALSHAAFDFHISLNFFMLDTCFQSNTETQ